MSSGMPLPCVGMAAGSSTSPCTASAAPLRGAILRSGSTGVVGSASPLQAPVSGSLLRGPSTGWFKAGVFGRAADLVIETPFRVFLGTAANEGLWLIFFLGAFIWVTIAWGLINWLPIGGLDGWHILSELLEKWLPGRGRQVAAVIGLIVALIAAFFLFRLGMTFGAIILVLFALQALGGR